jgi:hypothetical protein
LAAYTESAWGSTDATYPSVLTKRWVTTNETVVAANSDTSQTSDYDFETEWSVAGRRLNSLDAVDGDANRADSEILVKFSLNETSLVDFPYGLVIRGGGSAGSEDGYVVSIDEAGFDDLRCNLSKYVAGTATTLASGRIHDRFEYGSGDEMYLRFRVNGSSLKAKLWNSRYSEPADWDVEDTDTSVTAAGWCGIWNFAANFLCKTDWISIGTNGDTAGFVVDTTSVARVTKSDVQVMSAGEAQARLTKSDVQVMSAGEAQARLTKSDVQVLYKPLLIDGRVTQTISEVLRDGSPKARATQNVAEVLRDGSPKARTTQTIVEVLRSLQTQDVRLTQQVAELAVYQNLANIEARSTQQIVEVLVQFRGQVTQQMAELAVQQNLANVEARSTQQIVEVLGRILGFQVSQQVAELGVYQNLANIEARSTQQLVEVLFQSEVRFGVTQQVAEAAVYQNLANIEARSTQQLVEVLLTVVGSRVTQQVAEAAVYQNLANIEARSTQQLVEVLLESIPNPQLTQQVAEAAVYQNLANIEARSTQQVVEVVLETVNYGRVSQQIAEAAVYQNLANIETRSTHQIIEVLFFTGLEKVIIVTQSVAETAVRQNADSIDVSSTHQIIEVLITVVALDGPAYDNFDAQPISIMV